MHGQQNINILKKLQVQSSKPSHILALRCARKLDYKLPAKQSCTFQQRIFDCIVASRGPYRLLEMQSFYHS